MSTYNAKNYTAHGGEETVIGGKLLINGTLEFAEGAVVEGRTAANQADSTASTVSALKDDLNALLAKLKVAGLMEPDETAGDGE